MNLGFTIPMRNDSLDGVTTFLAVAETNSFTAAALRLGVSPTAVSKAIRVMERKHGVTLFVRTTRRVALTEAGNAAFLRLRPAALEISETFAALGDFREKPMGTLRITAPHSTFDLLSALVPLFRETYPDVTLELSLDDAIVDIVASGYDAGIRFGESLEKDMVAIRLTPDIRWLVVGAPRYLDIAGRPTTPEELVHHEAIHYRFPSSHALHRWGFKRGKRKFLVDIPGRLIIDERRLLVEFAVRGLGLAFVADREVREYLADGRLEQFLEKFIPSEGGIYLYFPKRSLNQPKLRTFVETARKSILS